MFEFIDVLFALIAGVVFTIIMLVLGVPLDIWLTNLILIMIIMLIVGVVYKAYIKKIIFKDKKGEDKKEQGDIETDNENENARDVENTKETKIITEFPDDDLD